MLSVSYFEKALYELPPEEVTAAKIKELADQTEFDIVGGYAIRPILCVSVVGRLELVWLFDRKLLMRKSLLPASSILTSSVMKLAVTIMATRSRKCRSTKPDAFSKKGTAALSKTQR